MSNAQVRPEDVRKIHAEINQIVNQRFLLTTLAVTLFGTVAALTTPRGGIPSEHVGFTFTFSYVTSMLLFVMFALLFVSSLNLRNYLRVLSTYLDEAGLSQWERDWAKFRSGGYSAYTTTQTFFFLTLGMVATAYPFLIEILYQGCITWRWVNILTLILFFAHEILVAFLGFRKCTNAESRLRKRWRSILASEKIEKNQSFSNQTHNSDASEEAAKNTEPLTSNVMTESKKVEIP